MQEITDAIIRKNLTTEPAIEKLFEIHIDRNRGTLDEVYCILFGGSFRRLHYTFFSVVFVDFSKHWKKILVFDLHEVNSLDAINT